MYAPGNAMIVKRPFRPGSAALVSGFVVVGLAFITFMMAIILAISYSNAISDITLVFLRLTSISVGICLLFLLMLFRQEAPGSKVAPFAIPIGATALGLLALSEILEMVNICIVSITD